MRTAHWHEYELIDTSSGERLERWGDILLIRPDPQIIVAHGAEETRAGARRTRATTAHRAAAAAWQVRRKTPPVWNIRYGDLTFRVKTDGLQAHRRVPGAGGQLGAGRGELIQRRGAAGARAEPLRLHGRGHAGLRRRPGPSVCHVDASQAAWCSWARENAQASGLEDRPIRWLVDDCMKFVQREQRRGHRYDGIIMDPPSYGRGPGGEVWKLEEQIYSLVEQCVPILSEKPLFFLLEFLHHRPFRRGDGISARRFDSETVRRQGLLRMKSACP